MRKTLIITGTLLIAILLVLGGCAKPAPAPEAEPPPEAAPVPEPAPVPETAPAEFEVTSLAVTPIVAEPGQAVTVEVGVMNVGETRGSYTLTLTVNGVEEEVRKDVAVAGGATDAAAFTLVRDASGIYEIEVAGLTETLRVKQPGAYPRLGNCYFAGRYSLEEAHALAKWDLAVVHHLARKKSQYVKLIKELNPNIKILAFVQTGAYNARADPWVPVREDWLLHHPGTKPPEERRVVVFTQEITRYELWFGYNPTSEWSTWLPNYVHDEVMSTGLFDGVFYDSLFDDVWKSNIDIDNDGIADNPAVVKREYRKGWAQLLKLTRELLGPEAIIFGNPGVEWAEDSPYWDYANGHMQENALGTMFGSSWPKIWEIYQRNMRKPSPPSRIHLIGVDTNMKEFGNIAEPDFPPSELRKMRFGLAMTLLQDGYFGFDLGTEIHHQLWWFPEYDANLGLAKGDAQERSDGTWMREFENGVVVANPTNKESTVEFQDIYKDVTTGIEASHFVVPPEDGRIFLKSD